jgi:transcriptional regulator with XRE-family HTH domain
MAAKTTADKLNIIGKNIKKLRDKHKMTQADLSFYIFADKSLISALERNVQKNITLLTLGRIAKLFELSVVDLLQENLEV